MNAACKNYCLKAEAKAMERSVGKLYEALTWKCGALRGFRLKGEEELFDAKIVFVLSGKTFCRHAVMNRK